MKGLNRRSGLDMATDGPSDDLQTALRYLPDQVRDIAVRAADVDGLPDVSAIEQIVLLGVGGARVAGDVVEAICELRGSVPVRACGARVPAWVSKSTLAVVISQSGDDQAAVAAARSARSAGAMLIAITAGGELGAWATAEEICVVAIDPAAGTAAGLGVTVVPVLVLLERLGFVTGMSRAVSRAAAQISQRLDAGLQSEPIEELAETLIGRLAIVASAGAVGKHAARRWVQQIDRAGGVPAVRRRLPTGPRDIATGVRLAAVTTNGVVLILLRHDYEPEGLDGGVTLAEDEFEHVHTVVAEGKGPLAQLLDLVVTADAVVAAIRSHTGTL